MLLRTAVLERIVRGEISLVFRRWRRPTVRTGGTLRTALGVLRILEVAKVEESDVTDADAAAAGCASRAALLDGCGARAGQLYRIAVEYAGADPRIALRQQDALSDAAVDDVLRRLNRLDARSPTGPWTLRVLAEIEGRPRRRGPGAGPTAGLREGLVEAADPQAQGPRAHRQPAHRLRAVATGPGSRSNASRDRGPDARKRPTRGCRYTRMSISGSARQPRTMRQRRTNSQGPSRPPHDGRAPAGLSRKLMRNPSRGRGRGISPASWLRPRTRRSRAAAAARRSVRDRG